MTVLRYAAVAATAGSLDLLLFGLFAKLLGYPWLPVAAMTFTLATALNYWLGIRYAFTSGLRYAPRTEFAMVFVVSLAGLGINLLALAGDIKLLGLDLLLAKLGANLLSFAWNYLARRYLVFGSPRRYLGSE